jgi:hypothetical protein
MLAGCRNCFQSKIIDYAFISTHSQETHGAVKGTLSAAGYRIEVSSDFDNETTSYDGFLFASNAATCDRLFQAFKPMPRLQILQDRPADMIAFLTATGLEVR